MTTDDEIKKKYAEELRDVPHIDEILAAARYDQDLKWEARFRHASSSGSVTRKEYA
jgi:hypothetical protein